MKQLAIANKSVGGGVIVVLAEKEKEEMEMDIAKLEFDFMGTSVICRSGSPLILADLKKVLMGVSLTLSSIFRGKGTFYINSVNHIMWGIGFELFTSTFLLPNYFLCSQI